jgi:hypothetical protein
MGGSGSRPRGEREADADADSMDFLLVPTPTLVPRAGTPRERASPGPPPRVRLLASF